MRVLVAGASSRLGRYLCAALRREGHVVRGMSRSGEDLDADESVAADVCAPESLPAAVDGVDALISVVGAPVWPTPLARETTFEATDRDGNLALFAAARDAGVSRVVYLSVFGEYPPGLRYVECHREVEAWLADSGLTWSAVRPTGFFGAFDVFAELARTGLSVRVGSGEARTNPIHEADLAEVLVDALSAEGVVECGGPDVLTRAEIARLAFGDGASRLAPVPAFALRAQVALVRPVFRRAGDVLAFLHHVVLHDAVAPIRGERRLADYFRR